MDLRIFKTKKEIKRAFLALREQRMPAEIKVKDICEMAAINKTTFYKHYEDSQALSDAIDSDSLDRVMEDFDERASLLESPSKYSSGLLAALDRQKKELFLVFRGRAEELGAKLEARLSALYQAEKQSQKIKISFIIGGLIGVIKEHFPGRSDVSLKDAVAEYAAQIAELMESVAAKGEKG